MLSSTILIATLLYAGIGLAIFVLGFLLCDKLTPVDLWGVICKGNTAFSIFAGAIAVGLSMIISAAIHG